MHSYTHIVASDEAGTQNPEKNLKSFIQVLNDFCVSFMLVVWELLSFVQVSYNFVHFSCKFYGEKLLQLVLNLIFVYPNFHFNTNIKEEAWLFFRKVTASQFDNFFYECVRYPLILSLFIHCKYLSSNNGEKNSEKLYVLSWKKRS